MYTWFLPIFWAIYCNITSVGTLCFYLCYYIKWWAFVWPPMQTLKLTKSTLLDGIHNHPKSPGRFCQQLGTPCKSNMGMFRYLCSIYLLLLFFILVLLLSFESFVASFRAATWRAAEWALLSKKQSNSPNRHFKNTLLMRTSTKILFFWKLRCSLVRSISCQIGEKEQLLTKFNCWLQ